MNSVHIEEARAINHPFLREREAKGKRPGARAFLALIDGVEVGLLIFEHFSSTSTGFVSEIYVLPEFRGMDVGNQLLLHAEAVALDSACQTLRLFARSLDQEFINDESLMSWYGRKGFVREISPSDGMRKRLVTLSTTGG